MAKKQDDRTSSKSLEEIISEIIRRPDFNPVTLDGQQEAATGHEIAVFSPTLLRQDVFEVKISIKKKAVEQPHRDLERRVIGEKRHVKLTEAEQTAKAQSESGKDRVAAKKAETDAIAAEVQAAAKQLLVSGSEKHLITGMLAQRTWGPEANRYKDSWIRELLKRKLPA